LFPTAGIKIPFSREPNFLEFSIKMQLQSKHSIQIFFPVSILRISLYSQQFFSLQLVLLKKEATAHLPDNGLWLPHFEKKWRPCTKRIVFLIPASHAILPIVPA